MLYSLGNVSDFASIQREGGAERQDMVIGSGADAAKQRKVRRRKHGHGSGACAADPQRVESADASPLVMRCCVARTSKRPPVPWRGRSRTGYSTSILEASMLVCLRLGSWKLGPHPRATSDHPPQHTSWARGRARNAHHDH